MEDLENNVKIEPTVILAKNALLNHTVVENESLWDIMIKNKNRRGKKRVYYPIGARPILKELKAIWPEPQFYYIERVAGSKPTNSR